MKYIFRTLWVIGWIPVVALTIICFFIIAIVYPFAEMFFLIKEGKLVDILFSPELIIKMWEMYGKLLEYIENVH